jgi:hypothetical protein
MNFTDRKLAWEDQGKSLSRSGSDISWAVARWVVEGRSVYPEDKTLYKEAARITGKKVKTLRDYAYTYRATSSQQDERLSFAHHAEVAALEPEQQKALLDQAANERFSVADLRKAVRSLSPKEKPQQKPTQEPTQKPAPVTPRKSLAERVQEFDSAIESEFEQVPSRISAAERREIVEHLLGTAQRLQELAEKYQQSIVEEPEVTEDQVDRLLSDLDWTIDAAQ